MKRWYGVLIGLLLFVLTPSAGWAATISCGETDGASSGRIGAAVDEKIEPSAGVLVGDEVLDLSRCIVQAGKLFILNASFDAAAGGGEVHAVMNPDPFITFGATTINAVPGPVTYAFIFGTPIVPGFYNTATSTGGVTVTNGIGGTSSVTTSAVYPTYISGYGTLGGASTNLGVDIGLATCTAGPGAPATETKVCDQGDGLNTFPLTFYDNLEALLTYTQDDTASSAGWTGGITLSTTAVPEPASLSLVTMGLVMLGAFGLVRRRRD